VREVPASAEESAWLTQSYAAAKEQALRRFEKGYVEALMKACDSNISAAARKAGMDRSNFKRVLRKYRTDVEPDAGDDGERATA
jgi:DNA-binding NtrC family response regulator